MNRVLTAMAVTGVVLMGAQAFADPRSQPQTPRHQLMDCMTRRMSADKKLAYNQAAKLCKEQLKTQNGAITPSNPAKSANAHYQ